MVVIPARIASKRLENKLLQKVDGKTVLEHTYSRASKARQPYVTVIATDGTEELTAEAKRICKYVYPTDPNLRCGTCRVAKVSTHRELTKADIVVNVQADELLVDPNLIDELINTLADDVSIDMVTAVIKRPKDHAPVAKSTVEAKLEDGLLVDLVRFDNNKAKKEYFEHIGIAAFRKTALFKYMKWNPSDRDRAQKNEYLTAIDNGLRIKVVEYNGDVLNINTADDLKKAEEYFKPKEEPVKKRRAKKVKNGKS